MRGLICRMHLMVFCLLREPMASICYERNDMLHACDSVLLIADTHGKQLWVVVWNGNDFELLECY